MGEIMNFYNENANILREKHKINLFNQEMDMENYKIMKNDQESAIAMVKKDKKWFYIDYEDKRIDSFIRDIKQDRRTFILIGFGLGNSSRKLLKSIGNNKLIIIENDIQMLNYALAINDISDILKDDRTRLYICKNQNDVNDVFQDHIKNIFFSNLVDVIICPGYREVQEEFTSCAIEVIKTVFNNTIVNKNTLEYMSEDIIKTVFDNIPYIGKASPINVMKDIFKGKTAVVVSSGPSLSKNLKYLKKYNNNVVIITCSRNLDYLASEGIIPHLACTIDPCDFAYNLIENSINKDIFFISGEHANSKAMKNIDGKNIFCTTLFQEFINKITRRDYEKFPGISSVAHLCTIMAVYTGCKNVVLIGQDLAYTDNKRHDDFDGDKYGDNIVNDTSGLFYVEGNTEEKVLTDLGFQNFKEWFEEYIAKNSQVSFINCTEGGAKIQGTKIEKLEVILGQLCFEEINGEQLIKNIYEKNANVDKYTYVHEMMKLEEELIIMKLRYEEGVELCKSIYEYNNGNIKVDINKIISRFSKIDEISEGKAYINSLINLIALVPLKKIMQDSELIENSNDSAKEKGIKYARRNSAVCSLYVDCMDKILKLVMQAIVSLKQI